MLVKPTPPPYPPTNAPTHLQPTDLPPPPPARGPHRDLSTEHSYQGMGMARAASATAAASTNVVAVTLRSAARPPCRLARRAPRARSHATRQEKTGHLPESERTVSSTVTMKTPFHSPRRAERLRSLTALKSAPCRTGSAGSAPAQGEKNGRHGLSRAAGSARRPPLGI